MKETHILIPLLLPNLSPTHPPQFLLPKNKKHANGVYIVGLTLELKLSFLLWLKKKFKNQFIYFIIIFN